MMRRVELEEGQLFDETMLQRGGAFDPDVLASTASIVAEVRKRGDEALHEFSEKFDHVMLKEFRLPDEALASALDGVGDDIFEALTLAATNIRDFHERQKTQSWFTTRSDGALVGSKVTPLDCVGIYIPGGRAQYPSTVLMNAIPAKVAGVGRIIMCTPPRSDGSIDPCTLAAARIAGVDEVYCVGGAHAIAAMAYGTASIPKVDKVTGPGNAYVAAAKKLVNGDVGIDMIAGPSEVCVMADNFAQPELIAIDLMAQAEHDPNASCYLVTTDAELADETEEFLAEFLAQTTREEITRASLENKGVIVICPDLASVIQTVNVIAPEHLEINMTDPMELLGAIRHAGAIFLGEFTPESVGDYVAGPNHTLPTSGTARFSSPLSVDDFVKRSSVISYTYSSLAHDALAITTIAAQEGLWSHAKAVQVRLEMVEEMYKEMEEEGEEEDECTDHGHHHIHAAGCNCGCEA